MNNIMANKKGGLSRRTQALIYMLGVAIIIGVLIAYEQISILYVLATVSIVVLLLIVGFTDLESASRPDGEKAA